jgi:hypothetical protein
LQKKIRRIAINVKPLPISIGIKDLKKSARENISKTKLTGLKKFKLKIINKWQV